MYPLSVAETCTHGDVLWTDGVEKLGANRHSHVSKVHKQLATHLQTLVNFKCTVDIWVVDETFPANSRTRFLRVGKESFRKAADQLDRESPRYLTMKRDEAK